MQILKDWTAKRAGAHITISGKDAKTGKTIKVVGVERIAGGNDGSGKATMAIDKDGTRYEFA